MSNMTTSEQTNTKPKVVTPKREPEPEPQPDPQPQPKPKPQTHSHHTPHTTHARTRRRVRHTARVSGRSFVLNQPANRQRGEGFVTGRGVVIIVRFHPDHGRPQITTRSRCPLGRVGVLATEYVVTRCSIVERGSVDGITSGAVLPVIGCTSRGVVQDVE